MLKIKDIFTRFGAFHSCDISSRDPVKQTFDYMILFLSDKKSFR